MDRANSEKEASRLASKYELGDDGASELRSLTDGSTERMEALAKRLSLSPRQASPLIDSGVTGGKGGKLTMEQAQKLSMNEYAEARKQGRI